LTEPSSLAADRGQLLFDFENGKDCTLKSPATR
jgi:hypothetical protein